MVKFLIDSREPKSIRLTAKRQGIPYRSVSLSVGDFQTDKTVFERKTINDLIQSIHGQITAAGYRKQRFFEQLTAMKEHCEEKNKVGFLLISGDLTKTIKWFKKRKLKLNLAAIYGALASAIVRYGVSVIWFPTDRELLKMAWKIAQKIDEGKLGLPHRSPLRRVHHDKRIALIANVLRVSPRISERMFKKFGGLGHIMKILEKKPNRLYLIDGVGKKTIERMRMLVGFE